MKAMIARANGGIEEYANGGFPTGIYKGVPGGIHKFAEPETGWEAYISGKPDQRQRNIGLWQETGRRLGVESQAAASTPPAVYVQNRSEEHTSELQSLMRTSYAVFCLKKKKKKNNTNDNYK